MVRARTADAFATTSRSPLKDKPAKNGERASLYGLVILPFLTGRYCRIHAAIFSFCAGVMGPENAAATIACILERAGHINSAGGYLRDLTSRAQRGEFSLGPALMALLRSNGETQGRVA